MADLPNTAGALRRHVETALQDNGVVDAALETRLLLESFVGLSRLDLMTRPETMIDATRIAAMAVAFERRLAGEPVHRIIGQRQFYGLDLALSAETLEPRPDTEILVDAALPFLEKIAETKKNCLILDVGTGTGAICLAILSQIPVAKGVGIDISQDALATAARNSKALGLADRFETLHSDCFENVSGTFDAILSNPPYIASADIAGLQAEVRNFDPLRALDGGPDGLDFYREIASEAKAYLNAGGIVGVEIGFDQHDSVPNVFAAEGWRLVHAASDLGGHQRVLIFMRS